MHEKRHRHWSFPCAISQGLIVLALGSVSITADAQRVTVAKIEGRAAKNLSPPAHTAVGEALKSKGVEVVPWEDYVSTADTKGIPAEQVASAEKIPAMSEELKLDAVIKFDAKWKEKLGKTDLGVTVLDPKGLPVATRNYTYAGRSRIPADTLEAIASDLQTIFKEFRIGAPPPPTGPMDTETPTVITPPPPPPLDDEPLAPEPKMGQGGAMSDALIAVGFGLNLRSGLEPNHASNLFPSVRADGHLLAGAFTDAVFWRDLGLGGMFQRGFALEYAAKEGGQSWSSSHTQYRAELLYRLALLDETKLKPMFLIRAGVSDLISTIDAPASIERVRSVRYLAPQGGLDVYLMLLDPIVRVRLGGAYLFAIQLGKELSGQASGFVLDAGVDVVLLGWLHTAIGWEMARYAIEDKGVPGAPPMGETDDLYNNFYLRVGWSFDRK
ncbi:MAG: hypothetical protein MUC50_01630 [Myxococcota bacterium]|jgi:hypothetical protein|nr:hypothetical protein [Myxococcota bacterium]